jgi:hypothetical protein
MSRRFTLREAEELLPLIDGLIRHAVARKASYQEAEEALQGIAQRVMVMGGLLLDRDAVAGLTERRDSAGQALKETLARIHEQGCLVKDLDIGLVDFPTLLAGTEVYLCWKMGESGIRYWHGVHEGFAGRKEIDDFFLKNHSAASE